MVEKIDFEILYFHFRMIHRVQSVFLQNVCVNVHLATGQSVCPSLNTHEIIVYCFRLLFRRFLGRYLPIMLLGRRAGIPTYLPTDKASTHNLPGK